MAGTVVGAPSHIPINHGSSSSTNFADVLASSYNISIADYNEASHAEESRVETMLGQSNVHEGSCETPYGQVHSQPLPHDGNAVSLDRRYSNASIVSSSTLMK